VKFTVVGPHVYGALFKPGLALKQIVCLNTISPLRSELFSVINIVGLAIGSVLSLEVRVSGNISTRTLPSRLD